MTERVVASWIDAPFTSHDRRGVHVEHRVVLKRWESEDVDVRHEIRAPSADGLPDQWTEAEVYESRPHGVDKVTRRQIP